MASLRRRRRLGDESGVELLELALVLPILLLVFAAIIDFGLMFQRFGVLTNAAREGARVAVLPGYGEADAEARVQSYLTASGLTDATPVTDVVYGTQVLSEGGSSIHIATVTVEYPSGWVYLGPIAMLFGEGARSAMTLRTVAVMRVEGQGIGGS